MAKLSGKRSILQRGGPLVGDAFSTVAQRISIDGPGKSADAIDATDLDSLVMEKRPGLADPGELTLRIYFDPELTGHTDIEADADYPAVRYWKIAFNKGTGSGTTWPARVFPAFVSGFNTTGMVVDGLVEAEIKLTVTGLAVSSTYTVP